MSVIGKFYKARVAPNIKSQDDLNDLLSEIESDHIIAYLNKRGYIVIPLDIFEFDSMKALMAQLDKVNAHLNIRPSWK